MRQAKDVGLNLPVVAVVPYVEWEAGKVHRRSIVLTVVVKAGVGRNRANGKIERN